MTCLRITFVLLGCLRSPPDTVPFPSKKQTPIRLARVSESCLPFKSRAKEDRTKELSTRHTPRLGSSGKHCCDKLPSFSKIWRNDTPPYPPPFEDPGHRVENSRPAGPTGEGGAHGTGERRGHVPSPDRRAPTARGVGSPPSHVSRLLGGQRCEGEPGRETWVPEPGRPGQRWGRGSAASGAAAPRGEEGAPPGADSRGQRGSGRR